MHALIPLLFIFILFNSKQIKLDKLYRANIFALVGISYFCLLQYTIYWYRIFPTEHVQQYLPGLLAVLTTVAVALSPWNRRSHPAKTAALCGIFAVTLVVSFTFDKSIKESLAEIGGFFQRDLVLKPTAATTLATKPIELPTIGLQLRLTQDWQPKQLSSGHHYFTAVQEGKIKVEIRPNCLGALEIDTPTYLSNILTLSEARDAGTQYAFQCAKQGATKLCLVKVQYSSTNELKEKWHWLEIPSDPARAFGMDILMFENSAEWERKVADILATVGPSEGAATEPCRTPAAWL